MQKIELECFCGTTTNTDKYREITQQVSLDEKSFEWLDTEETESDRKTGNGPHLPNALPVGCLASKRTRRNSIVQLLLSLALNVEVPLIVAYL